MDVHPPQHPLLRWRDFWVHLGTITAGLLIALGHFGMLPVPDTSAALRGVFTAFGVGSATLYAAGLAFSAESLARTGVSLLYVEEDRYRLLARNMSDVISRHRRNGAVQFVSPAAETMLGTPVSRLLGHGLFDRDDRDASQGTSAAHQ